MPLDLDPHSGTNSEEISKLSRDFNVKLEDSYKKFLRRTNGYGLFLSHYYECNEFVVPVRNRKFPFEVFFDGMLGIRKGRFGIRERSKILKLKHAIAIADTAPSGLIVFIDLPEIRGYYFYDYRFFIEESTKENNTYFLARTFRELQEIVMHPVKEELDYYN